VRVATLLPDNLTITIASVLRDYGIEHRRALTAEDAASDAETVALIGPYFSTEVAEAAEVTAPARLPLLAPVATWSGVTRADEPHGPDEPAAGEGTVFRIVARDTVVAQRIAAHARAGGRSAYVVAGAHPYGRQLEQQLTAARLPRVDDPADADLVVLAGLVGEPEIETAAALAPLPIVAFDGVQGSSLGDRDAWLALPYEPVSAGPVGLPQARRAAALAGKAILSGAEDRESLLISLRQLGPFDEHGDPVDPPVSLWRVGDGWELELHRALPAEADYG
jgi:hypothetical protein